MTGEWVSLADADDQYTPEYVTRIAGLVERHDADFVMLADLFLPSKGHCLRLTLLESFVRPVEYGDGLRAARRNAASEPRPNSVLA